MITAEDLAQNAVTQLPPGVGDFAESNAEILSAGIPVIVTVGVYVPHGQDGLILTGKRRDNGLWTNPGGHMDAGETPAAAAAREVFEESGINVAAYEMRQVSAERIISHRTGKEFAVLAFVVMLPEPALPSNALDPDEEISVWKWVPLHRYTPELHPNARHAKKDSILAHFGLWTEGDKMELTESQQKRLEVVMSAEPATADHRFMSFLEDAHSGANQLRAGSSVERHLKRLAEHVVNDPEEAK